MASYSDNFDAYADGPLANNAAWENTGGGGMEVFSNQVAEDPGAGFQFSSVTVATANFAADGEAQCEIATFSSFDFGGVGYRITTNNGYFAYAGDGEYVLDKVVSGVSTEIGSNATAPASGHDLKIVCSGTTISVELDTGAGFNQIISVTDSDLSSGQPGLCYNRQNSNATRLDNFSSVDAATGLTISTVTDPIVSGSNFTITGTGFEASQGAGSVTVGGQAASVSAWSDTSITASINIESTSAKYGANDVVVTNDSAESDTLAAHTVNPEADNDFVNIGTLATAGDRITAIPDLASGDQVRYGSILYQGGSPTAYAVSVASNGVFTVSGGPVPDGTYTFSVNAWDSGDLSWGAETNQTVIFGDVVSSVVREIDGTIINAEQIDGVLKS